MRAHLVMHYAYAFTPERLESIVTRLLSGHDTHTMQLVTILYN